MNEKLNFSYSILFFTKEPSKKTIQVKGHKSWLFIFFFFWGSNSIFEELEEEEKKISSN